MSDIDALRTPNAETTRKTQAHDRLANVQTDAHARRQKLVDQLAMADEFISLLRDELSQNTALDVMSREVVPREEQGRIEAAPPLAVGR